MQPQEEEGEPRRRGPEGSAFDAEDRRRPAKGLARRIRRWISRAFVSAVVHTAPYLYYAYCWFVWRTSRVHDQINPDYCAALEKHDRVVGLVWHQEVFTVAFAYRPTRPHTLASAGNFGRVITRMLELCDYRVFRGGSSGARTRRRSVLRDMIEHMQRERRVGYGITVDGSKGPIFRMKHGGAAIARACRAPIYLARMWYARRIELPTWDRTTIPLPFNRIRSWLIGPYWIDPDCSEEEFERAVAHLEAELLELAEVSFAEFEQDYDPSLRRGFPEGWKPRWERGRPYGLKRTEWDLDPERPPPWAHRPPHTPADGGA